MKFNGPVITPLPPLYHPYYPRDTPQEALQLGVHIESLCVLHIDSPYGPPLTQYNLYYKRKIGVVVGLSTFETLLDAKASLCSTPVS